MNIEEAWRDSHFEWLGSADVAIDSAWKTAYVDLACDVDARVVSIQEQLAMPDGPVHHLDAFSDLLSELWWVSEPGVILTHGGKGASHQDRASAYFTILMDALEAWHSRPPCRLRVLFDERERDHVFEVFQQAWRER